MSIKINGNYFDWQIGVNTTVVQWDGSSLTAKCCTEHGVYYFARVHALEAPKK